MWERRPAAEIALRVLETLFEDRHGSRSTREHSAAGGSPWAPGPGVEAHHAFQLTPFQIEGARRVREILARRDGAILADAVGLGKTYVALDILEERIHAGHDAVVIVPASLRRVWRTALRRLDRAASSRGSPHDGERGSWLLVSHAQLSRGVAIRPAAGPRLIVVDEAHRFRNPTTRRYRGLARLVHGPESGRGPVELLLITATPVNNGVEDLYHLVRLFLRDDALRDVGVPSLLAGFQPETGVRAGPRGGEAPPGRAEPPRYDAGQVRAVTRAVQVRRTRGMVAARFGELAPARTRVGFPRRAPPSFHRYVDPRIGAAVRGIEALELRAYDAAGPLVRLGLLKRLDSSAAAFVASVARLRAALEAVAEAADAGRLLRPGGRPLAGDADPLQLFLLDVVAGEAPPDVDLAALAASCRRDLHVLKRLTGPTPSTDAKSETLRRLLERLGREKVVVFTEYRDTAEDLARRLAGRFRVGRVDGSGAWLGRRPAGRRTVVDRFAPIANGRPTPPDRERVDVLIATDVLSEGLDLQDARHVVSYDLPWNPVRLLQRIGRVDRLGSPHRVVYPHLFVPAGGLDAVLGLTRKLRTKLDGIVVAVGGSFADQILAGLRAGRPEVVAAVLDRVAEREAVDPWERLRTLWLATRGARGPRRRPGPWIGVVEVPSSHPAASAQAVVLTDGHNPRLVEVAASGEAGSPGPATVAVIEAALTDEARQEESARPAGPAIGPDACRRTRLAIRRAVAHLRAEAAAARAPTPLQATGPEARLTRRIRQGLARAGSGLDPGTLRRAETLLQALSAPLPPAARAAVAALLQRTDDTVPTGRRIRDALRVLGRHGVPGPGRPEAPQTRAPGRRPSGAIGAGREPRIEAVLLIEIRPV